MDTKWSPDIKEWLRELCEILDCNFHTPKERIPHRWLSVLDVSADILEMLPALLCMYFAYVPKDMKYAYLPLVKKLIDALDSSDYKRVLEIGKLCEDKFKASTTAGKERKKQIVKKLFYSSTETLIQLHFYNDILPTFKSFILIFQQDGPQIHRLHDEQTDLVRHFLSSFIKHEYLKCASASSLKKLDVKASKFHLPLKEMFNGAKAERLLKDMKEPAASQLWKRLKDAYVNAGDYLLKKMPLDNHLLSRLSAIDPTAMGHSATYIALRKLPRHFTSILCEDDDDKEKYDKEVSAIQLDTDLPPVENDGKVISLDQWWNRIFAGGKYPVLSRIIKGALSIFCGPKIEQSFSVMNHLINKKTNRISVTYQAYQDIKYDLQAKDTNTIKLYHREDILKSPVDRAICYYIQTASSRHKGKQKNATVGTTKKKQGCIGKVKKTVKQTSWHQRAAKAKQAKEAKRNKKGPSKRNI